jgi:serine/threonine-protein phosphatase PP1 catalytic subunit
LRVDGPVYVCTGTLGNYHELSNIIDRCGHPKFMNYLFLGDYAGRYEQSIECLVALFAYRLYMPSNFFLLRGCHETLALARAYQLREQLSDFFHSSRAWIEACETFTALPYAAVVDEKIFCLHGGLSPYLQSLDQINRIPRPLDAADRDLPCDLLWADPSNLHEGWTESERGVSVCFGSDVVSSFLKTHDLTLVCRGHEVAYQGFKFFAEKKMVTLTSLAQHCGQTNNSSAVMVVDEQSNVLFKLISDRNNYSGTDQEEGLTFVDIVQRKKEREERKTIEEAERRTHSNRGTREHKTRPRKE